MGGDKGGKGGRQFFFIYMATLYRGRCRDALIVIRSYHFGGPHLRIVSANYARRNGYKISHKELLVWSPILVRGNRGGWVYGNREFGEG